VDYFGAVHNEGAMDPDKSLRQEFLHVRDLFLGVYLGPVFQMDLDVVCQAFDKQQLIETDPGGLPVGTHREIPLIQQGLFFFQLPITCWSTK
jgi:hypothetical protein